MVDVIQEDGSRVKPKNIKCDINDGDFDLAQSVYIDLKEKDCHNLKKYIKTSNMIY